MNRLSKKCQFIIQGLGTVFVAGILIVISCQTAWAADSCAAPSTNYGTDTMHASIPQTGSYTVWTHLKISSSSANSVLLNVGGTCYDVGGSTSIPVNTWEWIDYHDGKSSNTIVQSLNQGNESVELIGTSSGVRVDQVEFVSSGCIPAGDGSNCTLITTTGGGSSEDSLPSTSTSVSSQKGSSATLSPSTKSDDAILFVQYYLNNKLIAMVSAAPFTYNLNTKKILNGTYTLKTKTTYASGKSTTSSRTIVIKNPASLTQLILLAEHYIIPESIGLVVLIIGYIIVRKLLKSRRRPTNNVPPPSNGDAYESLLTMYSPGSSPPTRPQAPTTLPTGTMPNGNGEDSQRTQSQ